MSARLARLVLYLLLAGCKRSPGVVDAGSPDATPPPSSSATPPPPSSSAAQPSDPLADFEDQFAYVTGDAGAAGGDRARLTIAEGFRDYHNERFGFMVSVPKALVAEPEPTNGDGRQWRLGRDVSMIASGMMNVLDEATPVCTRSSNVTAQRKTKDGCWATGKRGGYVFWERFALKNDVLYSLRFQYAESLKETMDPIVTTVNASWAY